MRSTTYSEKRTNHLLHLILSILTGGIWLPIWLIVGLTNKARREKAVTIVQ